MDFESATSKEQCVWPFAGVSCGRCLRDLRIRRNGWTVLFASLATLIAAAPVFAQTAIARPAQALQYVAAEGSDANDGLTRQAPKSSISAAYDALPPCHSGHYWAHCGRIRLGAGTYVISSPIVVKSPQVSIRGAGQGVTILEFTGTSGCAIEWTGHQNGAWRTGGLFDLTIDGSKAGPQACGLRTYDMGGFNAREVEVLNFAGPHGIGWDDTVIRRFNERDNVSMTLFNNTTGWMVEGGVGRPGYPFPGTTFGYGNFNLWINTSKPGQVGIHIENHAYIQFVNLHVIENMTKGTTALELTDNSAIQSSLVNLHFEGGATGISTDSTSEVQAIGTVYESTPMTDSFGGTYPQDYIFGYWGSSCPHDNACLLSFAPYQRAAANYVFTLGKAADVGRSAELAIGVPEGSYNPPLAIGNAGHVKFWVGPSGGVHGASGYLISAGTTTLSNGIASHTFKTPYTSAPVCTATDETSASPVQVQSDTTGVTVRGPDGDKITWICTPQAN